MQPRVLRGGGERQVVDRRAEAEVEHTGAVVGRPDDSLREARRKAGAVGAQHFHGHQPAGPAVAGNADPVVRVRRDDPGDRGAVAVVVVRVPIVVDVVVTCNELSLQVRLSGIDACVEDPDHDL